VRHLEYQRHVQGRFAGEFSQWPAGPGELPAVQNKNRRGPGRFFVGRGRGSAGVYTSAERIPGGVRREKFSRGIAAYGQRWRRRGVAGKPRQRGRSSGGEQWGTGNTGDRRSAGGAAGIAESGR